MNDPIAIPPPLPSTLPAQTPSHPSPVDQDADHLRLLAVFHYVLGGFTLIMCCWPGVYLFIGIALLAGIGNGRDRAGEMIAGAILTTGASVFVLAGLVIAGLLIYAGRCLTRRRRYVLCMVVAGMACMFVPLGTALGVFSLIVLLRPPVKALFAA
ncbi:MAG: hypothetical protein LBL59_00050 [Xanthomonadaceae bacterium]|jgi:hypothetical protein|nr:hypothetical protein [Xanthomonadaceae bacterium]